MKALSKTIVLRSEAETAALGQSLSRLARKGDCLLLKGQIGAGKSTLARAFIQDRFGAETEVPSPTFTLVQIYEGADLEIWHADLYRLTDPQEAVELGLMDALEQNICLIEWPELLGDQVPDTALNVDLSVEQSGHRAVLSGNAGWLERLEGLAQDA